jgi:aminomethyltransferase
MGGDLGDLGDLDRPGPRRFGWKSAGGGLGYELRGGSTSEPPRVRFPGAPMSNLRTPLYEWHVAHKARMVPFGGWDMPVQYAGIGPEHRAVRTAAGLFDISHMARVNVGGADAGALLEKVFTNSVATMADGQVRYGLVCAEAGGILDDVLVYRLGGGYAVVVNASNREKILAWLDRHRTGWRSRSRTGRSPRRWSRCRGRRRPSCSPGCSPTTWAGCGTTSPRSPSYLGNPCVVSRTGYTGEDGFEVVVPNELALSLWGELLSRGGGAVRAGRPRHAPAGGGHAAVRARAERGDRPDPGRARVGGEARKRGVRRPRRPAGGGRGAEQAGARGAGDRRPAGGPRRVRDRQRRRPAGRHGDQRRALPWLDKSLAMGYAEPAFAAVGSALDVDMRGTRLPATVVPLPFYKRKK